MKAIDHHLFQRNGYLYYRNSFPLQLQPILLKREIRLSLGTRDIGTARLCVAQLDIEIDILTASILSKLADASNHSDIDKIKGWLEGELDNIKAKIGIRTKPHNIHLLSSYQPQQQKEMTFSELAELYLKDCVTNSSKTIEHKRITYEMFQGICRDLPVSKIGRTEGRKFKDKMIESPANLTKILNVKSYLDVDWNNLPDLPAQSLVTVNTRLISMISLFTWAERNDFYDGKNPFAGMIIKKADTLSKKRPPFTTEDIQTFFSSPIYKGSKGERPKERMVAGNLIIKDYKYWIPLLGLYTGMRLNEICQLMKDDIQKIDNIWVINIDYSEDKKLKTASSRRHVPIHDKLIEIGFLEYVRGINYPRLFAELPKCGKGSYSYRFSKEFAIMLKHLGLKDKDLCFHSFRHSFIDELRNTGVEKAIAMKLVGHHSTNDTHEGYGYGYNLEVLQRAVNELSFY